MVRNKSNNSKQINSTYQSLYLWTSFLLGMISLGIIVWQRMSGVALAGYSIFNLATVTHDNSQSSYQIQFPGLTPLVLSSALAYQTGNPGVGLLGSLPLWLAIPVSAQTPRTVVPEFRVNSNMTFTQDTPTVARVSSDEWVVVWRGNQTGNSDIYAQSFASNGSVLGPEFRVNSNTLGTRYYPVVTSSIISISVEEWVVVWEGLQTGNYDIYAQRFATNRSMLGSEFSVNRRGDNQQGPVAASVNSAEWVIVWQSTQLGNYDIYAQRFATNGSVIGAEIRVNNNTAGDQAGPTVANVSAGEWVVVWNGRQTGDWNIYAQRFATNGSMLGSEFRVNSNTTGDQLGKIASLSSGGWVVVWNGRQTGDWNIYAQRFAMNGSMLGAEFRVNSNATGNQDSLVVASVSPDEWVAVWRGDQTGDYDIYAQRFATNGSRIGSEFRVNSNMTGAQNSPAIASGSLGEWMVVWLGDQTGDFDIYGSIFSSTEPLSTTGFPTPSTSVPGSSLSSTVMSTLTTQASSPSSMPLPTTDNSVKTQAITPSANSFTSASSGGMTSTVTITTPALTLATSQTLNTAPTTPQQVTATNDNSGISGTVIGAAAGAGGFALAACLGAIGFYACRKKGRSNKVDSVEKNETGIALGATQTTTKQSPSQEYGAFPALGVQDVSGTVALGTNRMSEYASFRSPAEQHYSNSIPSVPTDPYAGFKFVGQKELNQMNREVDEDQAQKALHDNYDDVSVLASNSDLQLKTK